VTENFSNPTNHLPIPDVQPLYVTQPHLPPLEEFLPYLEEIWAGKKLTNNGPFHKQLEVALCDFLGVEYVSLFANATISLLAAVRALGLTGEVITTPYSFVATSHALLWNGIVPVFVDIDPLTLNMDPAKIEAAITPQTTGMMPVHVYGHPCDVDAIEAIAQKYELKVIYDAAHAFGVRCHCGSVLQHGDLSVLSFHATKVFNTFEGGAVVSPDAQTKRHIDQLKNFGFENETTVTEVGINGKMSEFNAALGLLQLRYFEEAVQRRQLIDAAYRRGLRDIPGIRCMAIPGEIGTNYAYFPIFVGEDYPLSRDGLYQRLKEAGIYSRRYFYPLISSFPMYRNLPSAAPSHLAVATKVAEQVLCLPIYPALKDEEVAHIIAQIQGAR
jgi:dTDP-4-amino-4,6-dideoxygalactose transaminase